MAARLEVGHDLPSVISVSHGAGGGTARHAGTDTATAGETLIGTGRSKDNDPGGDDVKIKIKAGNQLCSDCDINELVQNNFNEHCDLSSENCQLKKEIKIYKSLCEQQVTPQIYREYFHPPGNEGWQ